MSETPGASTSTSAGNTTPPSSSADATAARKQRTRRALNCEPCRLHKLRCNRARPCSGCISRGTQDKCFPATSDSGSSLPSSTSNNISVPTAASVAAATRYHAASAPPDPGAELNQIQSSLSTLQRYYRSLKRHAEESTPPTFATVYEDALLGSDSVEAFFVGPTHACTPLYTYFERYPPQPTLIAKSDPNGGGSILDLSKFLLSNDLLAWLPPKPALETLVAEYLDSATWIQRYVDEDELNRKLDRYINHNELDELTMALFFALSATTLHYIPWDHKIRRNWPEDSNITASRFYTLAQTILERSYESLMSHPSLALIELHLMLAHYHNTVKSPTSGEEMWALSHRMISIALSMGLHRDFAISASARNHKSGSSAKGGDREIQRRRWAWWNIISFERWTCVLLGRPPSIANNAFSTSFPIPPPPSPTQTATDNVQLPYLMLFRYHLILGNILSDISSLTTPLTPERAAQHDAALSAWRASWPPDLELTEYKIATSLARTSASDVQRRGMQSLHLLGTFYYTRFILHRPVQSPSTRELLATNASALVGLISRCVYDVMMNPRMRVIGQIGIGPWYIVLPGIFYTHQLLENPTQPAATNFRASLAEILGIAAQSESLATSQRTMRLLGANSVIAPRPHRRSPSTSTSAGGADNKDDAGIEQDLERIKILKRLTFPYVGITPDVEGCDADDVFVPIPDGERRASAGGESGVGNGRTSSGQPQSQNQPNPVNATPQTPYHVPPPGPPSQYPNYSQPYPSQSRVPTLSGSSSSTPSSTNGSAPQPVPSFIASYQSSPSQSHFAPHPPSQPPLRPPMFTPSSSGTPDPSRVTPAFLTARLGGSSGQS